MSASIILTTLLQWLLIPLLSPLVVGVIKSLKARLQRRQGPSIFQVYRDLGKLFAKDEVISRDASWIFTTTPFILFVLTLVIGASIPIITIAQPLLGVSDFLVIIYLFALGTFFVAAAGMDAGSPFGGFGSSREMTVAALAEAGLLFSLLVPVLLAGTSNVIAIVPALAQVPAEPYVFLALGFVGFFIALLAETGRFPFDNPATHLELTMIHEAMILEYSGKRLALIEWASANKLLILLMLGANVFFPWGLAIAETPLALLGAFLVVFGKVFILTAGIAVIESSIAKYRFFRLPDVLLTSFILSAVAISFVM